MIDRAFLPFALLLASVASVSAGEHRVTDPATLASALESAAPGDVILLADGSYGTVTISRAFPTMVTLRSEKPLGAKFDQITVSNSSHLVLDGLHVDSPSNGKSGPALLQIRDSDNITVINSRMNGKVDAVYPIAGWFGIRADDSSHIKIWNNQVHDVLNGISMIESDHLLVQDNFVDRVGSDFYKFAGVDTALVENNTGGGNSFATPDAHEDFMQFQGAASSNVTIRGNVFLVQNSAGVQGIFMTGDGGHRDILIEDNIIYTGIHNGIVVSSGTGIVVRNNTVLNAPGTVHKATVILVPAGAISQNNITGGARGQISDGNLVAQYEGRGSKFFYNALYSDALRGPGLTIADLRPVAGSLAQTMGAARRLAELLQ